MSNTIVELGDLGLHESAHLLINRTLAAHSAHATGALGSGRRER